jgi:hypothetical protein
MNCHRTLIAEGEVCRVEQCRCGTLHLTLGALTLRLEPAAITDVARTLDRALDALPRPHAPSAGPNEAPPPPHDPSERELAHVLGDWEVRIFGDRKFSYFVERGLWHVQLWHPAARVSVLTPSRLTRDAYEVYPSRGWKARAATHAEVGRLVSEEHGVRFVNEAALAAIERIFVHAPIAFSESPRGAS